MRTGRPKGSKHEDPYHYATLEEVAKQLGVSTFAVWQTEQRALRKLRELPLIRQLVVEEFGEGAKL